MRQDASVTTVAARRSRREADILDAARRVILHDGVDGLRAQALAEEAGISVATPYHYFPSLDDIACAVWARERGLAQTRRDVAEQSVGMDPAAQLQAVLAADFDQRQAIVVETWAVRLEYQRRAVFDPRLRALVLDGERAAVAQLARIVEQLPSPTRLGPDAVARRLHALSSGLGTLVVLGLIDAAGATQLLVDAAGDCGAWRPTADRGRDAVSDLSSSNRFAARSPATRILDATIALIAQVGAGGVTFAGVAELAGVSGSLPRYHFGSRRALLTAAFARNTELARERMLHQAMAADPLARLATIYIDPAPAGLSALRPTLVLWSEYVGGATRDSAMRTVARERLETWIDYGLSLGLELAAAGAARRERIVRDGSLRQVAVNTGAGTLWLIGVLDDHAYPDVVNGAIDDALGR